MEQFITPGGAGFNVDKLVDTPAIIGETPYLYGRNVWQSKRKNGDALSIIAVEPLSELEAKAARALSKNGLSPIASIKAIRARHHELARLLATGMKEGEVAKIVGINPTTLSMIKRSPAFAALLAHYHSIRDVEALGIRDKIKEAGLDVLLLIQDRLQEHGDKIPISELRKLAETFLDRSGHSPVQKSVTMNAGLSAAEIAEIRRANDVGTAQPEPAAGGGAAAARYAPGAPTLDLSVAGDEGGGKGV